MREAGSQTVSSTPDCPVASSTPISMHVASNTPTLFPMQPSCSDTSTRTEGGLWDAGGAEAAERGNLAQRHARRRLPAGAPPAPPLGALSISRARSLSLSITLRPAEHLRFAPAQHTKTNHAALAIHDCGEQEGANEDESMTNDADDAVCHKVPPPLPPLCSTLAKTQRSTGERWPVQCWPIEHWPIEHERGQPVLR